MSNAHATEEHGPHTVHFNGQHMLANVYHPRAARRCRFRADFEPVQGLK